MNAVKMNEFVAKIENRIKDRIDHLGPIRDAVVRGQMRVEDIGYLSSGERATVLLASGLDRELDSPLFTFLQLDDDLQVFILLSRERPDLIGSRIAYNI
ncbi:hypothetical protein MCEMSEM22_02333 [Comamonadaceae bacterium]